MMERKTLTVVATWDIDVTEEEAEMLLNEDCEESYKQTTLWYYIKCWDSKDNPREVQDAEHVVYHGLDVSETL